MELKTISSVVETFKPRVERAAIDTQKLAPRMRATSWSEGPMVHPLGGGTTKVLGSNPLVSRSLICSNYCARPLKPMKLYGCLTAEQGQLGYVSSKGIALDNGQQRRRRRTVVAAAAVPAAALSAAVTLVVVGAAVVTIIRNKEKLQSSEVAKEKCGECHGSGLCPACNGDGFLLKNLTPEAAAKARSGAVDAATRYTAGLAKKWSYCSTCLGSRSCPACRGQGFIDD